MTINTYQVYAQVRCTVAVATTTGNVTATTLTAYAWNVNGSSTATQTFTTAGGTLLQNVGDKTFYFDVFADSEGDFRYTMYSSTGLYPGRASGQFRVVDQVFS